MFESHRTKPILLATAYLLMAAVSPIAPLTATLGLVLTCYIVTLPYFLRQLQVALENHLKGMFLSKVILLLSIFVPLLILLLPILGLRGLGRRLVQFSKHVPYVICGLFLYSLLGLIAGLNALAPPATHVWPERASLCAMAGAAAALLCVACLLALRGYVLPQDEALTMMLGMGTYLLITGVFIALSCIGIAHVGSDLVGDSSLDHTAESNDHGLW